MTIEETIITRGITEVLHFTTCLGLTGILDARLLKSRTRIKPDQRLRYILKLNTERVLDPAWEDYVNFSISKVNYTLFNISSSHWHPDQEWCILSYSPEILSHAGVCFTTTNNIYPSAKRGHGPDCLDNLFKPVVYGRYNSIIQRAHDAPDRRQLLLSISDN